MPAPSGPRSGKHGAVRRDGTTFINTVRNWSINETQQEEDQVHSGTLGGHDRENSYEDWNGTCEGFGGLPPLFPGETFNFEGFTTPDDGVYGHTGLIITGDAIVDSITINWVFQPGQSINWTMNFSANGCIDEDSGVLIDIPDTCINRMCNLKIQYSDECTDPGEYTLWDNVLTASLTITAANIPFTNSSTNCCTYRRPGIIDWNASVVDQEAYKVLTKGRVYALRMFTSLTEYWELQWGLLRAIENYTVDFETGRIIDKSNSFAMKGLNCCYGETTPTIGSIINPAAVTKWPIEADEE